MAKFNSTSKGASSSTKILSKDGVSAFKPSAYQELCDRVLTSFFGEDRYYESGKESSDNLIALVKKVAQEDPVFVGKLAVLAREQFNLRSVTQAMTAELAKVHKGNSLVSNVVERIAQRPDDLTELISYLIGQSTVKEDLKGRKAHTNKKIPNSVKKGVAKAFRKFSEYQLSKYKSERKEVSLADVVRLVHPKPENDEQAALWGRLVRGELAPADTWETNVSAAGQGNKSAEEKEDAKTQAWEEMILAKKLPYMAALRNIRNIMKAGVSKEAHQMLQDYISNEKAVANSKQLPFRYWSAYKAISAESGVDPFVKKGYIKAIGQALALSAKNIERLPGRTVLAADLSGSMRQPLSADSTIQVIEVGAVLCSLASQFCEESITCGFASSFKLFDLSDDRNNVMADIEKIMNTNLGGSTDAEKVMQYLISKNIKVDNIIFFTDMQLNGSYGWGGNSLQGDINTYRSKVNKDARIYELNLAGYGSTQIDPKDTNYVHMAGWSDNVLKYITQYQQLRHGIVEMVNKVELLTE